MTSNADSRFCTKFDWLGENVEPFVLAGEIIKFISASNRSKLKKVPMWPLKWALNIDPDKRLPLKLAI